MSKSQSIFTETLLTIFFSDTGKTGNVPEFEVDKF